MTDEAGARGKAFVRITGAQDIEAAPKPAGPVVLDDEIDTSDGSLPPDPKKARVWWDNATARFKPDGRWQCGFDVSRPPLGEEFDALTLDARLDVYLGARARATRETPDRELERRASREWLNP
jgi:hypothetical protein